MKIKILNLLNNLYKMSKMTIPQMNKKLEELNSYFSIKSSVFCTEINKHEGRFKEDDYKQFCQLIENIKEYAKTNINNFFQRKIADKTEIYDDQITKFTESGEQTQEDLRVFREELEQSTVELKQTQNRKQALLEYFSSKYNRNTTLKKFWKILQQHTSESKRMKNLNIKMTEVYQRNLMKKVFFPWRRLTYKDGYENTVRKQTESDIASIHEQYQSIVSILKGKIAQTDQIIKVKKAAKGQFAYALSKNLLKTISNLSMEVMSLNQMSLNDGQVSERQTNQFMKSLDGIINDKLHKVREFKNNLLANDEDQEGGRDRKKKKITFI